MIRNISKFDEIIIKITMFLLLLIAIGYLSLIIKDLL
jgi:hypothetical protein